MNIRHTQLILQRTAPIPVIMYFVCFGILFKSPRCAADSQLNSSLQRATRDSDCFKATNIVPAFKTTRARGTMPRALNL